MLVSNVFVSFDSDVERDIGLFVEQQRIYIGTMFLVGETHSSECN